MPRFYCDYCDAYLTHDSMSGRQQHMRGWKHRENFKNYYQTFFPQWAMETQMQQMQNPQYQMMIAAGYMPPFGAPDGSMGGAGFDPNQMQQMQQMHAQQMQMQGQMMGQQGMPGQAGPAGLVPPPMMPPVFRAPPSMPPAMS